MQSHFRFLACERPKLIIFVATPLHHQLEKPVLLNSTVTQPQMMTIVRTPRLLPRPRWMKSFVGRWCPIAEFRINWDTASIWDVINFRRCKFLHNPTGVGKISIKATDTLAVWPCWIFDNETWSRKITSTLIKGTFSVENWVELGGGGLYGTSHVFDIEWAGKLLRFWIEFHITNILIVDVDLDGSKPESQKLLKCFRPFPKSNPNPWASHSNKNRSSLQKTLWSPSNCDESLFKFLHIVVKLTFTLRRRSDLLSVEDSRLRVIHLIARREKCSERILHL